jgi:hypothetical protein
MKLSSVRALKEELLSVPTELVEHVAAARSFRAFVDRRETANRAMHDIALGVAFRAKNDYRLAVRPQRSGPLISAVIEQIERESRGELDAQYIGNIVKLAKKGTRRANSTQPAFYRARRRPLRVGSSISDESTSVISAGTLGCFVVGRRSPHYLGILTNNHVIANENANSTGEPIVQPGTLDEGESPIDQVGELGRFVRLRPNRVNFVDAAVGDLYEQIPYDPRQIGNLGDLNGVGDVTELPAMPTVYKVGRTTGQTEGRMTAFDVDNVWVEYDLGWLRFDNQIEIEGAGDGAFSDSGDSGSLIVDEQLRAIGLLFAGGDEGGSNGQGLTYANPIQNVLDQLQVDLEL